MIACYARLRDLSDELLEELSLGIGTDDECEVVAAQMILADRRRTIFIGGGNTGNAIRVGNYLWPRRD